MALKLEQLTAVLDELAPLSTQEAWDNSGIQIAAGPADIQRVLVSLEITDAVIEEANEEDVDMIITHHPLIFGGIHRVDYRETTGAYLVRLLNLGISVYSCHTPFDKLAGGNNDHLAQQIGLQDVGCFYAEGQPEPIGRVGHLPEPVTLVSLLDTLAERLAMDPAQIRVAGRPDMVVSTIGICTGAGADLLDTAADNECDLFITGDVKYHDAQKARAMGIAVIDAGHYGTEKSFAGNFAALLRSKTGTALEILTSQVDIDPFEMV